MNLDEYLNKIQEVQNCLIDFIEEKDDNESDFQNLKRKLLNGIKITSDFLDITILFHLLNSISNNHKRGPDFFIKIDRILSIFKDEIKNKLTNFEIFNIFQKNKIILLSLIEQKILFIDEQISEKIFMEKRLSMQLHLYFWPESKNFDIMSQLYEDDILEYQDNFNELRKQGENHNYICQLIRKDSIDEFISYINKTNLSLNSSIPNSLFETNPFLIENSIDRMDSIYKDDKHISLIEYAAFYGSIRIFKYLLANEVELKPSLFLYAIHGENSEIIHLIEECEIKDISFQQCYEEAIKCHHNQIANYIYDNFLNDNKSSFIKQCLKYHNFQFIQKHIEINNDTFYYLCKYNYFYLANIFIQNYQKQININYEKVKQKELEKYNSGFKFCKCKETALNISVIKGNIDIVKLLLKQKEIDVNAPSIIQKTTKEFDDFDKIDDMKYEKIKNALIYAVEKGNIEIIRLLLENDNIDVNFQLEKRTLYRDDEIGMWTEGSEWIDYGIGKLIKRSALIIAVEREKLEIVRLLLNNQKIDPNSQELYINYRGFGASDDVMFERFESPSLNIAISKCNLEISKLLLNHDKIDVNIPSLKYVDLKYFDGHFDDEFSQHESDDENYEEEVCYDICKCEKNALEIAIYKIDNFEVVQLLLNSKKIDLNHCITKTKVFTVMKPLLFYAVENDNIDSVKLLLNLKIFDVNFIVIEGNRQKTALCCAINNNNIEMVKLLLEQENIDVNLKIVSYENEKAPLFCAIEKGNIEIIKLLLAHKNIDVNAKCRINGRNETIFDIALQMRNREIFSLIKNIKKSK